MRERKKLKLLMGTEGRGGMSKSVGEREGCVGRGLLNEEAVEPFLLLSNCMLV